MKVFLLLGKFIRFICISETCHDNNVLGTGAERSSKIMMAIKHMMYYFGLGMNNDGKNIKNSLKCTQCRKRLIMRLSGKLQSTHAQNKLSCTKTNHLRKVRLMV